MNARKLSILSGLLMVSTSVCAQDSGAARNWDGELRATMLHHDNFFMTGDEASAPQRSALVSVLYAGAGRSMRTDAGRRWEVSGSLEAAFNRDVADADTQTWRVGAGTRFSETRLNAELVHRANRIYSEDGDGVFFDQNGISLGLRHPLGQRITGSAEYGFERHDFSGFAAARDADVHELVGTLRAALSEGAAVRVFGLWSEKTARDDARSWSAAGVGVALEWSRSPTWQLFSRVRVREREYRDALAADNNFQRDDTILDALINARVLLGASWGIGGQIEFRDGESTRLDRNYDATTLSLNVFKAF